MKRRAGKAGNVARRRTGPARLPAPCAANDNSRNAKLAVRYCWDVYRAAARARYVGQVIAADADEAIEAAAVEFKSDIKKLIAAQRWAVAS